MPANRQFVIDHLPTGKLTPDVFKAAESAIPSPGDGEVLVRTRYISLDAANRAWMWGRDLPRRHQGRRCLATRRDARVVR